MEKVAYLVYMIESEEGYGSKVDEILYFKTKELALQYVKEYNERYNNLGVTPSWYIVAQYYGCKMVDMTNKQFTETWYFK